MLRDWHIPTTTTTKPASDVATEHHHTTTAIPPPPPAQHFASSHNARLSAKSKSSSVRPHPVMTQATTSSFRMLRIFKKDGGSGGAAASSGGGGGGTRGGGRSGGGGQQDLNANKVKPTDRSRSTPGRLRNLLPLGGAGTVSSSATRSNHRHDAKPSSATSVKNGRVRAHKTADKRSSGRAPSDYSSSSTGTPRSSRSTRGSASREKNLFYFESSVVATPDELDLRAIDEGAAADHVSLVWSKDMLTSAQHKFYHAQGLSSKHLPNRVYLSDRHVACDRALLDHLDVEFIVNCTHSTPCLFEEEMTGDDCMDRFRYHRVPLSDDSSENLLQHLPTAVGFMNNLRSSDTFRMHSGVVLVHCSLGVSRSASVVIGWMMTTLGMPVLDALRLVCGRRKVAKPQPIFLRQLLDLERKLFGEDHMSLRERDLDACIVCLEETFLEPKQELLCGHLCCASCFASGVTQCSICIATKSSRRRR